MCPAAWREREREINENAQKLSIVCYNAMASLMFNNRSNSQKKASAAVALMEQNPSSQLGSTHKKRIKDAFHCRESERGRRKSKKISITLCTKRKELKLNVFCGNLLTFLQK
jgi:hypothetical protein